MGYEQLMAVTVPLASAAEAVAALAASIRLDLDGETADPRVRAALHRVVSALCENGTLENVDQSQLRSMVGTVTAFLKQALDLLEEPARPPGWVYTDAAILQSQGQSSAAIPPLIAQCASTLDGLDVTLARDDARILDVGSGVGALAISCCRVFPAASVVGVDPWEPAQELARANVAAAGLADRITLRRGRIEEFDETRAFDLAWVPTLFLSPAVLDGAIARATESLRDGGWIVLGLYAGAADPVAQALVDLRTVRGGGTPMSDNDAVALLRRSGLSTVHAVPKTWPAPIRFVVGQRR